MLIIISELSPEASEPVYAQINNFSRTGKLIDLEDNAASEDGKFIINILFVQFTLSYYNITKYKRHICIFHGKFMFEYHG